MKKIKQDEFLQFPIYEKINTGDDDYDDLVSLL